MQIRQFFLGVVLFAIPFFASPAMPQEKGTTPGDARQPQAVIRATTRLVQVSVVVQDKKGEPLTGLKKEDFAVFDEGVAQNIAVFSSASPAAPAVPNPLPPNVFTNRFDLKGQDPGTVTIVLFDWLNTAATDQAYVRKEILRFLQTLKPQDHVAVYALTSELLLLHEFTQDAAALVNAVTHFSPKEMAQFDASHPEYFDVPALHDDPGWMRFQAQLNQANDEIAQQAKLDRAFVTSGALQAIAEHVAAIPGRKNLVWVSGGFPLQIGIGVSAPDQLAETLDLEAQKSAQALSRVNMAIYPVDVTGVATNAAMSPTNRTDLKCMDCINESPAPSPGSFARQDLRDSERFMADATGGQAFYGSNDIRDAMRRAFDDGRFAYTIGFYPNHGQWDGKFRKIKVQVSTDGAKLRYRKGYVAFSDSTVDESRIKAELQEAALSPIEATSLSMIVSGKLVEPASSRNLELHIGLDPKQLQLDIVQDHRKGALDLFLLQRDATGNMVAAEKQHIGVNLDEKQYEYLSRVAMVLEKHVVVQPQAAELRVVVRDAGSSILGSISLPVSAFLSGTPATLEPVTKNSN